MKCYMKKIIGFLMFTVLVSSAMAFAEDERVEVLNCRDARNIADSGYQVIISDGGLTGFTMAEVSELTIANPHILANVKITKTEMQGMDRIFSGNGFELTVHLEALIPTKEHTADLSLRQIVEGDIAQQISASLICTE